MTSFSCPHAVLRLARTATACVAATRAATWVGSRPCRSCAPRRPSLVAVMLPRMPGTFFLISRSSSVIGSITAGSLSIAASPARNDAHERHGRGRPLRRLPVGGRRRAGGYNEQPELDEPVDLDRGTEDAPAQLHGEAARCRPVAGPGEECPLRRRNLGGRQIDRRLAGDRRVGSEDRG